MKLNQEIAYLEEITQNNNYYKEPIVTTKEILLWLKELNEYRKKDKTITLTNKGPIKKYGKIKDIEYVKLTSLKEDIVSAVEFVYNIGMETCEMGLNMTVYDVRVNNGFDVETTNGLQHANFGDYIIKDKNQKYEILKEEVFLKKFF